MVSQGAGEDEVLETATEPTTEVIQLGSGGCAGIDEIGWSHTLGKDLSSDELQAKVENLRQKLLENSDVKKVRNAVIECGISQDEQLIALVKRYNFNSPGISFTPDNYYSWRRIANGQGTINDARYLVHEIAEVEELLSIKQQTGFDFTGFGWNNMTRKQKRQWQADFQDYYIQAHGKALEVEYQFVADQVSVATNGKISISRFVAAAIDPNRDEAHRYMLVDGVPLEEHPNFSDWQLCNQEIVKLNRNQRMRMGFTINPTFAELVRAVKQLKLNSF